MESYPYPVQQNPSSAPKIIYCTNCGAPACGTYCSNCGAPLRSEQPVYSEPAAQPMPQPIAEPAPNLNQPTVNPPAEEGDAPKRKKHTGLIVLSSIAAAAVVIMLTTMGIHFMLSTLSGLPDIGGVEIYRGGVSQTEFDRLELGMTYAHISSIIGGDGAPIESGTNVQGDAYYIYGWPGEYGETGAVYITFTNDVATEITLDGVL